MAAIGGGAEPGVPRHRSKSLLQGLQRPDLEGCTAQELQLTDPAAMQVFVVCNKVGEWLTGNLLGPLLVNAQESLQRAAGCAD